ncbi:MAG: hypothetical protein NTY64_21130, partial [Deltaproteobacteria bacterium]|nr:hypothetical protein [Deltaproteobacteria bacterium]
MKKGILSILLAIFWVGFIGTKGVWAAPALDYNVTHITQSPKYFKYSLYEVFDNVGFWSENSGIPYQTQGTENEKRWPQAGESITYTAHVVNKGTMECPPFQSRWLINGTEVNKGTYPHSIPPGYVAEVNWVYPWPAIDHTDHSKDTVTFEVLNSDDLPQNNKRTDYLAALSLSIWVDSGQYQAFNQKKNFTGTYSFEDWVQWQVQTMNESDKIVVAEHVAGEMGKDPDARTIDGRWQFTGDGPENYENYANEFAEKIDWGLIHELAHQLGVIDLYRIGLNPWDNFVQDDEGQPLNSGMTPFRNPGIMAGGDTRPHNDGTYFSSHDAGFLNANLGYRRGYYGEYLYDIPRNNYIRVLDNQGNPVSDAQVTVYQVATPANRYLSQPMPKGTRVVKIYKNASIFHPGMPVTIAGPDEFFTTVESINATTQEITLSDAARMDFGMGSNINRFGGVPGKAKFTGTTDANGLFFIPNADPYRTITTATKHTLQANPFGTINVVGFNAILYFKVKARGQTDYFDLNITDFNLAYWSGQKENFTHTYPSRIPPAVAPQPPLNLKINGEREKVS